MNKLYISWFLTVDVRGVLIIIIINYLKYIWLSEFSEAKILVSPEYMFFFSEFS